MTFIPHRRASAVFFFKRQLKNPGTYGILIKNEGKEAENIGNGFHDSCIVSMSFTSGMYVKKENPLPKPTGDTSYLVTDYQVPVGI